MSEFLVALGLVFVIEGALYALFPDQMRRFMAMSLSLPPDQLRTAGLAALFIGFLIVWLVRG